MQFKSLDDLYKYLSDEYGLIKYKDLTEEYARRMFDDLIQKKYTSAFLIFSLNIWRTLSAYRVLLEGYKSLESKENFVGQFEKYAPYETIMILLVTDIEVFLRRGFINIASVSTRNSVNCWYFPIFKEKFGIYDTDKIIDFTNSNITLNKLLPPIEKLAFQDRKVCSIAYKFCNIDIPHIDDELWGRLFSGEEDGYIKIRNKLIHRGFEASVKYAKILNKDFIERVILDIVKFAHKVDLTIVAEYPGAEFPQLYMN
jgi:hypothetical protein